MTKRLLCFLVMLVLVSAASVCYANEFALPVDGVPVSLEEAKQYPGLYIMDGDRFTRIGVTRNEFRKDRFNERLYLGNDAALFDADHEIMSIPNTAQLVVIGITDVDIEKVEITHAGYTVRDAVEIRTDREVVRLGRHSYALLNREDATRYIDRIISLIDQSEWTLSAYGVLAAARGAEFAFGNWVGTEYEEDIETADRRFYVFYRDRTDVAIIERTMNGYFKVNFASPPRGYHRVLVRYNPDPERWVGEFDLINFVEFVDP